MRKPKKVVLTYLILFPRIIKYFAESLRKEDGGNIDKKSQKGISSKYKPLFQL